MCKRPSRSLKSRVTALMPFSSERYLIRSSWILWAATRFLRCSFASRFNSSSSSYDSARKFRSSLDMKLLGEKPLLGGPILRIYRLTRRCSRVPIEIAYEGHQAFLSREWLKVRRTLESLLFDPHLHL